MPKSVEFFYDYASPYSYLAWTQLHRLRNAGAEVHTTCIDVLALQAAVGNSPTTLTCAPKRAYAGVDLHRWAKHYAVPFQWNEHLRKTDFRSLRRGAVVAIEAGLSGVYDGVVWNALWTSNQAIDCSDTLRNLLSAAGSSNAVWSDAALEAADAGLICALDTASEIGAFGTPTFLTGGEIYFGNDRIDFLLDSLAASGAA